MTAYLRPNPGLSIPGFLVNLTGTPPDTSRFQNLTTSVSLDYLIERRGKRGLRRDSARAATTIATSTQTDLVRTLGFTLRTAFIQLLQAKSFLALAQDNLTDYDEVLSQNRDRLQSGDIAQVDFDRLQLQRVQYESDLQTATVNVRTAKIQLLQLLNDQTTAVEAFDVTGPYDFAEPTRPLAELRQVALIMRPDLLAARQSIDKAKVDYQLAEANGSTDPDVGATVAWSRPPDGPENVALGIGFSIPLRIFDRNQGEKAKTKIDITRNEQLSDATRTQVLSDVDSAYATLHEHRRAAAAVQGHLSRAVHARARHRAVLLPGRAARRSSSFCRRSRTIAPVQLAYVNLIASYLNAVNQLNLAVGQEVIP